MHETLSEKTKILQRLVETKIGKETVGKTPQVSIIIPAYNVSETITETLDSIFAQTFQQFEVVLVNDGSRDTAKLEKVLADYFDKIIYGRQENGGCSSARNAAIALSHGELFAFLDGDDLWFPDCLEKQLQFLEEHNLDMVYCDAELFGDNFYKGKTYMETTPSNGEVNPISLINTNCNVITSGTMVRKEKLAEVGLFDPGATRAQDFDLWLRLAKNGARIGYQREILIKYRVASNSLSGTNVQRTERNITILNFVNKKYDFTAEEQKVLDDQIVLCEAEAELERGKLSLIKGRYAEARDHFAKANAYYRKPKLALLSFLINLSPELTLKLFKKFRPEEFSFISHGKV
jgi:teichuronic acid biosynthesis glycosyltransferase TuaG